MTAMWTERFFMTKAPGYFLSLSSSNRAYTRQTTKHDRVCCGDLIIGLAHWQFND